MQIPIHIIDFLKSTSDISIGRNKINFFNAEELEEKQAGYNFYLDGESISKDWAEELIVIGSDQVGDPIIVDTEESELTVFTAVREKDGWELYDIADSLENLKNIISRLQEISANRNTPIELEKKPISNEERESILAEIGRQNSSISIWYWSNLLEMCKEI